MRYVAVKTSDFNKILIRTFRYCLKKTDHYTYGISAVKEYAPSLSYNALRTIIHDIKSCDKFTHQHEPQLTELYQYLDNLIQNPTIEH